MWHNYNYTNLPFDFFRVRKLSFYRLSMHVERHLPYLSITVDVYMCSLLHYRATTCNDVCLSGRNGACVNFIASVGTRS